MRRLARSAAGRRTWGALVFALCAVLIAVAPGQLSHPSPAVDAHTIDSTWSASPHGAAERALLADRPQLRTTDGSPRPYLVAVLLFLIAAGLATRWPRTAATPTWLPRPGWSKAGFRERAPPRDPAFSI
jgi:hypothetical protein